MVSISRVRFPASLLHHCICSFVVQYKSRKFSRIAALHWSNSRVHPCCVVVICQINPPYARFCLTPFSTKKPRPVISPLTVRSQCAWYYRIDNVFFFRFCSSVKTIFTYIRYLSQPLWNCSHPIVIPVGYYLLNTVHVKYTVSHDIWPTVIYLWML